MKEEIITVIESFGDLLSFSDDKIDAFVKEVLSGNITRATNSKR